MHLPDQIIPGNCEKDPIPLDITAFFHYNVLAIGVWRSLVSRLVRVQEAAGSNPATPTKRNDSFRQKAVVSFVLFFFHSSLLSLLCKLSFQRKVKREERREMVSPAGIILNLIF